MSEVENGDSARHGSADPSRPEHALRARARRSRKHIEEVQAAFNERLALLQEQHEQWKKAAEAEIELQELEALAAEEGQRRDEAENGPPESHAEVVNRRPTLDTYKTFELADPADEMFAHG